MPIEKAIETLRAICPDIIQQGSLAKNEPYKSRFFTFWNPETSDRVHFDNEPSGCVWVLDVNFYSKDPQDVYSTLDAARAALRSAGWIISGKGHAVASDYKTHTGRGFTAVYLET